MLSRRVIDRQWFPAANRPGFHVIRPDSHWFLEQYIPFDFSSQAMLPDEQDAGAGRHRGRPAWATGAARRPTGSHTTRLTTTTRSPGGCRRWIARCLNIGTRYRLLTERDVRQAFEEAREGKPVVLAVTNHDFRDMRPDIDAVRACSRRWPRTSRTSRSGISEAVQAMREALGLAPQPPCELDLRLRAVGRRQARAARRRPRPPTFGPQPWLALKTVAGTYHHDNFDIAVPFHEWQYVFDEETFPAARAQRRRRRRQQRRTA